MKHSSHKVGMNHWHLVWSTKYRYKMMKKSGNKNLVEAAIRKAASENNIKIHVLNVQADHIHLLVTFPRGMVDSDAFQILKGRSAYLIFRNKEKTRLRYPRGHFWSSGGCSVSVGISDYSKTARYIVEQDVHHAEVI